MSTRYAEIFRKLQAPFDRRDLKTFSKGGKNFAYITARHAMIRLDMVVGPESWKDEYFETKEGLKCRLSIRFGDEWVGKEDGGGAAGMSDHDDDEKSAFSSAFKRAAVKWGIARELYGDGVATFDVPLPSAAAPAPRQAAPPPPTAQRQPRGPPPSSIIAPSRDSSPTASSTTSASSARGTPTPSLRSTASTPRATSSRSRSRRDTSPSRGPPTRPKSRNSWPDSRDSTKCGSRSRTKRRRT
jgi:hypothetical protein